MFLLKLFSFESSKLGIVVRIIMEGEILVRYVIVFDVRVFGLFERSQQLLNGEIDNVGKAANLRIFRYKLEVKILP